MEVFGGWDPWIGRGGRDPEEVFKIISWLGTGYHGTGSYRISRHSCIWSNSVQVPLQTGKGFAQCACGKHTVSGAPRSAQPGAQLNAARPPTPRETMDTRGGRSPSPNGVSRTTSPHSTPGDYRKHFLIKLPPWHLVESYWLSWYNLLLHSNSLETYLMCCGDTFSVGSVRTVGSLLKDIIIIHILILTTAVLVIDLCEIRTRYLRKLTFTNWQWSAPVARRFAHQHMGS